eukprot:2795099-Amphidinium_carterae.1
MRALVNSCGQRTLASGVAGKMGATCPRHKLCWQNLLHFGGKRNDVAHLTALCTSDDLCGSRQGYNDHHVTLNQEAHISAK